MRLIVSLLVCILIYSLCLVCYQVEAFDVKSNFNNQQDSEENDSTTNSMNDSDTSSNAQSRSRKRRQKIREEEDQKIVKKTIADAESEECDWKANPMAIVKGDICGSYYKVLGLNRKQPNLEKSDIKKAYRSKSLSVHPDKNTSPEAAQAFKYVQDAYECLMDDSCRKDYDSRLNVIESNVSQFRNALSRQLLTRSSKILQQAFRFISKASHYLYQFNMNIWDLAGELRLHLYGEERAIGQYILAVGLLVNGKRLLMQHALVSTILYFSDKIATFLNQFADSTSGLDDL